jgi:hypothetical protein
MTAEGTGGAPTCLLCCYFSGFSDLICLILICLIPGPIFLHLPCLIGLCFTGVSAPVFSSEFSKALLHQIAAATGLQQQKKLALNVRPVYFALLGFFIASSTIWFFSSST